MPAQMSPLMQSVLEESKRELAGRFRGVFSEEPFVCEHNSGRSQMAAALCHELSASQVAVRSAGSHPTERIDPVVAEAMSEVGIDVRMEFPKPLTEEVVSAADVVVTLGCGDACPVYPGKHYEDWPVADPAGWPIEVVRRIRYDIHHHVTDLLDKLGVAVAARPLLTPDQEP